MQVCSSRGPAAPLVEKSTTAQPTTHMHVPSWMTGVPALMTRELAAKEVPHWMENKDKGSYKSNTVVGKSMPCPPCKHTAWGSVHAVLCCAVLPSLAHPNCENQASMCCLLHAGKMYDAVVAHAAEHAPGASGASAGARAAPASAWSPLLWAVPGGEHWLLLAQELLEEYTLGMLSVMNR